MKKRSPIHDIALELNAEFVVQDGWAVPRTYGAVSATEDNMIHSVVLCDRSENGKFRIEGKTAGPFLQADDLPINAGKAIESGQLYRLRQDLFLLCTLAPRADTEASLAQRAMDSPDLITVTDLTHGQAELWMIGPKSAALLSQICGLDFYDSQFPSGAAKQSSVAKTNQIVIRHDLGDVPAYILIGPRSLAAYLWKTIMKAGQDLGILPVTTSTLEEWL
jgi:heterotetrameric sarcosine oxidase gamma subunit